MNSRHAEMIRNRRAWFAFTLIIVLQAAAYLVPVSVDGRIIFFIASAIIAAIAHIDARYFLLGAALHIWYALLATSASQAIVLQSAIFAGYYLAAGVSLLILEQVRAQEHARTAETSGPSHGSQWQSQQGHFVLDLPQLMEEHEMHRRRLRFDRMMRVLSRQAAWTYILIAAATVIAIAFLVPSLNERLNTIIAWFVLSVALGFVITRRFQESQET